MILKTLTEIEKDLVKLKKDVAELSKDMENLRERINIAELNAKFKETKIWGPKNTDQDNFIFDLYQ